MPAKRLLTREQFLAEIAKEEAEHPQLSEPQAALIVKQHHAKKPAKSVVEKAQKIEAKRSARSRSSDEKKRNQQTLPLNVENLEKWKKDPGRYDLAGIDSLKRIAKLFHKLRVKAPPRAPKEPKIVAYTRADLEVARSYLASHPHLYEDGPHYIELQSEIAKLVHQGVDPAVIDYAAHLSDDSSLHESLRSEMEFDILEMKEAR